ncbi:MAG: metal-dependent transcriptional regulator [Halorhabdus sp.]
MSHHTDSAVSESVEMYLKEIYLLSRDGGPARTGAIADRLDVSPPSVTQMLSRLQDEGLLEYQKRRGASLTADGTEQARDLLAKHCLIERFLVDGLGVTEGFHEEACRLEHALSDDVAARLTRYVQRREACPDCYDAEAKHCRHLSPTAGSNDHSKGKP